MKKYHLGLVAVLGFLTTPLRADDAPVGKDAEAAQMRADALALLPRAADLAALGRDVKSAETLVIAGGMLLRANSLFGGKTDPLKEQPTVEDGKPVGAATASVPLAQQADGLFDEARAMAAGGSKAAAVEALIKTVSAEFPKRGSVGGPQTVTRTLNPGETHRYNLNFYGGQPASVSMTSTGPAKIQFDVTHKSGTSLFSLRGHNAYYNWMPPRDRDTLRHVTVTMTNSGRNPTTYTFSKN